MKNKLLLRILRKSSAYTHISAFKFFLKFINLPSAVDRNNHLDVVDLVEAQNEPPHLSAENKGLQAELRKLACSYSVSDTVTPYDSLIIAAICRCALLVDLFIYTFLRFTDEKWEARQLNLAQKMVTCKRKGSASRQCFIAGAAHLITSMPSPRMEKTLDQSLLAVSKLRSLFMSPLFISREKTALKPTRVSISQIEKAWRAAPATQKSSDLDFTSSTPYFLPGKMIDSLDFLLGESIQLLREQLRYTNAFKKWIWAWE